MSKNLLLILIISSLCFWGCNRREIDVEKLIDKKAEEIYSIGEKYKINNKYEDAVLAFEELEKQYPYSKYVAKSQLEAGKCYFRLKKYESAVALLETFIQTHITHEKVPEALYLLGEIYFIQMPITSRDQTITIQSLEYFQGLCSNYPNSEYVSKAKEKIKILVQHLANHELKIGLYYQKLNNYTAAISRYNTIIESYSTTEIAEEAYYRLIECYISLNLLEEARNVNVVIQKLHHKSKWAKLSQKLMNKYYNSNKNSSILSSKNKKVNRCCCNNKLLFSKSNNKCTIVTNNSCNNINKENINKNSSKE